MEILLERFDLMVVIFFCTLGLGAVFSFFLWVYAMIRDWRRAKLHKDRYRRFQDSVSR